MSNTSGAYLLQLKEKLNRLYSLTELINKTTGLQGIVINLIDWTIHDIPSGWVKECFCKQLPNAPQSDLTEPFMQTISNTDQTKEQFVYRCPFQLANIVTPVLMNEQPIALLIIGPILNSDPVELISNFALPSGPYSFEELSRLKTQLEMLPKGDDEYLSAVSEMVRLLLESDQIRRSTTARERQRSSLKELDSSCVSTINIALEYINNNYTSEISLTTVAESAYIHPTHLSKLFSKQLKIRFRDYINQLRINEAKKLLLESSKLIADISSEVGFSDQSYFDKVFKQFEGLTPKQYRKQQGSKAFNHTNPPSN